MTEKQQFMKKVTIICDTREQENRHIITALDEMKVLHENRKLDFGDYSFSIDGRDFSLSCIIERKGCINELWTNTTKDRERFEKELTAAHNIAGSVNLLIENCLDWEYLRAYKVPEWQMKYQHRQVENIGEHIHNTLKSWCSHNRYGFEVHFSEKKEKSAACILSVFYWYWHNYKQLTRPLKR